MHYPPVEPNHWISFSIGALVVGVVMFLRIRSVGRERPLRLERLWILPTMYILFTAFMYRNYPPLGIVWLYAALALALGAAAGWWRGKMMRIFVDPETHVLNHRPSAAAVLFIFALFAIRLFARQLAVEGEVALHLNTMAITDILLAFAVGLLTMQRVEMFLRGRRLAAEEMKRAGRQFA